MRLLANENVPLVVVQELRTAGHDAAWIRTDRPGAPDEEVMALARAEDRILITFDKDFGELVYRRGEAATRGIVLFRLPAMPPVALASVVTAALGARFDWDGQFSVVEAGRVRMRRLPNP